MKRLIATYLPCLLFLSNPLIAQGTHAEMYRNIGQTTLEFKDPDRNRPIVTELWYPTQDRPKSRDSIWSPFIRNHTVRNGKLPKGKHPLVMISHGTGGNRLLLEWLAQALVWKGYLVAAVDHWGNTSDNKVALEFIKPWERPLDMSFALTKLLDHPAYGTIIDAERIAALGYSFGGYTVLALAGGILDYSALLAYYKTPVGKAELDEIREYPGISELLQDKAFIEMTKKVPSLKDPRFKAYFAISPGTAQGFTASEQFKTVEQPVFILGCEADKVTPVERYARHYHKLIKGSGYYEFPGQVGHYVMLPEAVDALKKEEPMVFGDAPGVDRHQIHLRTVELVEDFLDKNLLPK